MVRALRVAVAAVFHFAGAAVAQSTLDVPATYPSIALAMAAAAAGDTIVVAPGTYYEAVDFLGKAVTLASSAGAPTTILDGGQANTVVRFAQGETITSVLDGFTIAHGQGAAGEGGGVDIRNATPIIRNCRFVANVGGPPYTTVFGGVPAAFSGGAGAVTSVGGSVRIFDCTFVANTGGSSTPGTAPTLHGGAGAVSLSGGGPRLERCVFTSNVGGEGFGATGGRGGAGAVEFQISTAAALEACRFESNVGGDSRGFVGAGGAITVLGGGQGPAFLDCVFLANQAGSSVTQALGFGAPIFVGGGGAASLQAIATAFRNCIFARNLGGAGTGFPQGFAGGGALTVVSGSCLVSHAVLVDNVGGIGADAQTSGAGAIDAPPTLFGTFTAAVVGIENSIVRGNLDGAGGTTQARFAPPVTVPSTVVASNVEGGFPGAGNIDQPPVFVAPLLDDYHLEAVSPGIDLGIAGPASAAADIDGQPRSFYAAPDQGADEFVSVAFGGAVLDAAGLGEATFRIGGKSTPRVFVAAAAPTTLAVARPSILGQPANFVLAAVPGPAVQAAETALPGSVGQLVFSPLDPALVIVADTFGPGAMLPAGPAPWAATVPAAIPAGSVLLFQGVVEIAPFVLRTTNAIELAIQ